MQNPTRRQMLKTAGAATAALAMTPIDTVSSRAFGAAPKSDSLPIQLYKSLSDEQRQKICLPRDHQRRQYVSNWWYIHPEHRIPGTFNKDSKAEVCTKCDAGEFQSSSSAAACDTCDAGGWCGAGASSVTPVSYTHLRAHETDS